MIIKWSNHQNWSSDWLNSISLQFQFLIISINFSSIRTWKAFKRATTIHQFESAFLKRIFKVRVFFRKSKLSDLKLLFSISEIWFRSSVNLYELAANNTDTINLKVLLLSGQRPSERRILLRVRYQFSTKESATIFLEEDQYYWSKIALNIAILEGFSSVLLRRILYGSGYSLRDSITESEKWIIKEIFLQAVAIFEPNIVRSERQNSFTNNGHFSKKINNL